MKINLLIRYYSGGETPPLREDAAQTGKFVLQRDGGRPRPYDIFRGLGLPKYLFKLHTVCGTTTIVAYVPK